MAELPDDVIEAAHAALHAEYGTDCVSMGCEERSAARICVTASAARVRAEAVAGVRSRFLEELHEQAQLLPVEQAQMVSTWLARAAGSVPVATPDPLQLGTYLVDSYLSGREDGSEWALIDNAKPDDLRTNLQHALRLLAAHRPGPVATPTEPTGGAALIAAERKRQIDVEGWTAEHDDQHGPAVLLDASLCYQAGDLNPDPREYRNGYGRAAPLWPWNTSWWKPKDRLRNLVRAGALAQAAAEVAGRRVDAIAAEIDRLQAASPVPAEQPGNETACFCHGQGQFLPHERGIAGCAWAAEQPEER